MITSKFQKLKLHFFSEENSYLKMRSIPDGANKSSSTKMILKAHVYKSYSKHFESKLWSPPRKDQRGEVLWITTPFQWQVQHTWQKLSLSRANPPFSLGTI